MTSPPLRHSTPAALAQHLATTLWMPILNRFAQDEAVPAEEIETAYKTARREIAALIDREAQRHIGNPNWQRYDEKLLGWSTRIACALVATPNRDPEDHAPDSYDNLRERLDSILCRFIEAPSKEESAATIARLRLQPPRAAATTYEALIQREKGNNSGQGRA